MSRFSYFFSCPLIQAVYYLKRKKNKEGKQTDKRIKVETSKGIELSSFFVFHAIEMQFHPSFVSVWATLKIPVFLWYSFEEHLFKKKIYL